MPHSYLGFMKSKFNLAILINVSHLSSSTILNSPLLDMDLVFFLLRVLFCVVSFIYRFLRHPHEMNSGRDIRRVTTPIHLMWI